MDYPKLQRLMESLVLEGRYFAWCNGHGEVALMTAISKYRPANSSPDYYKAVGNYMCIDSVHCNKNITDITYLERFIKSVTG